jgi:hypothetical protein
MRRILRDLRGTAIFGACALCFSIFVIGWTYTYDVTTPPDTGESPRLGASRIREFKNSLQERANVDHYWAKTGNEVSDTNAGQHRKVTLHSAIATPSAVTDKGFVYLKTFDSNDELTWEDDQANELQITSKGELKVVAASIADANVLTVALADSAVTTAKIASASVTTVKLADANVTTAKIADANVTAAKVTAVLGARTTPDPEGGTVQATTDGFLVGLIVLQDTNLKSGYITCNVATQSDMSDAVVRGYAGGMRYNALTVNRYASFTVPIRKNEYYTVAYTAINSATATRTYYFVPLGS